MNTITMPAPHPTAQELEGLFRHKHGDLADLGWGPRLRSQFGYFTPDEVYEALLCKLITKETVWLDVGCGRDLFPSNHRTARLLADRCQLLVGLDPSDNIDENCFVHQRVKSTIEDFHADLTFDLVTMRMVAEHITNPGVTVTALSKLVKTGGRVVVYTVHKWSPLSIVSAAVPFWMHHPVKRLIWNSEEKDTFPTAYRMNTRRDPLGYFQKAGFREEYFVYLDDCRTFAKWRWLNTIELSLWKALRSMNCHYPEVCILGVYQKDAGSPCRQSGVNRICR
jgi:SAM-dependent methyltransferase